MVTMSEPKSTSPVCCRAATPHTNAAYTRMPTHGTPPPFRLRAQDRQPQLAYIAIRDCWPAAIAAATGRPARVRHNGWNGAPHLVVDRTHAVKVFGFNPSRRQSCRTSCRRKNPLPVGD